MEDFTGTTSADKISGKGGNDALSGGAGNDTIYSAIDLSVALRTKADEQWDLPVGATLKSKGSNWGIATTTDGQSTVNTYLQAGATDNAPDFIDAGAGDDTVIAGRGNDMVQGGLGTARKALCMRRMRHPVSKRFAMNYIAYRPYFTRARALFH